VAPLYVDQSRDSLDAEKTVFEEITGGQEEIVLGDFPTFCSGAPLPSWARTLENLSKHDDASV
jgi:hypothetical protein